ncbi:MAG: Hpt domain-containing protein [Gammaproteobacteria bacterium]|nr:Hpt domain-containing protein [Gammaproteobacteria bacterium]
MIATLNWHGREPNANERQRLAHLPGPLVLWLAPTLSQWAEAVVAYQGQTLVAAECRWPLPPHLPLQDLFATVAPEAPTSLDALLDHGLLMEYREMLGDQALLRMLALLRQHLPDYLALLGQAWAEADDSALRSAAHTLKGALATVGLKRLRNCAELLQTAPCGAEHSAALTALLQWCGRDLGMLSQQLELAAMLR